MMIDIDHVSFQYSGAEQENLQDFNLQIKKGECVVLTGESGCGKTCVTSTSNSNFVILHSNNPPFLFGNLFKKQFIYICTHPIFQNGISLLLLSSHR